MPSKGIMMTAAMTRGTTNASAGTSRCPACPVSLTPLKLHRFLGHLITRETVYEGARHGSSEQAPQSVPQGRARVGEGL